MEIENDLSESVDGLAADRQRRGIALAHLLIAAFALGYTLKSLIVGEPLTDSLLLLVASVFGSIPVFLSLLSTAESDEDA